MKYLLLTTLENEHKLGSTGTEWIAKKPSKKCPKHAINRHVMYRLEDYILDQYQSFKSYQYWIEVTSYIKDSMRYKRSYKNRIQSSKKKTSKELVYSFSVNLFHWRILAGLEWK